MAKDIKTAFDVKVVGFEVLSSISGFRKSAHYAALLDAMDYGDRTGMSEGDLADMCVLSLQDLEPSEAAALVLEHDMSDCLSPGQIKNLSHEMSDEKLWEHYADMALHERFFHVASLLFAAFPDVFFETDAVRVELEVVAKNEAAREVLAKPLHESFVVRLLADGLGKNSTLYRLFDEGLEGVSFPEADKIVWIVKVGVLDSDSVRVEVTSSGFWLDALRNTKSYESSACPDSI